MICYEDKLDTAINTGCPTTFGMERNGYLCLRSELNPKTETALVVDFVPRLIIPIFQPSENAYKPKSEGEKNAYGLTKYQKSIEVFLVANTELTQEQIMWLKDEDWVAVLKQRDETIIVFGFERGLRLKTSSQDLNSTETHGGVLLTFDENQVNAPMLFGTETLYDWQDLDTIYGGTIATGGAVKLTIDIDKTGYIKLPNGAILTTVGGEINETYTGVGGAITYYVPKDSNVYVQGSAISGDIVYSGENYIYADYCTSLTSLTAPLATITSVAICTSLTSLTAPLATSIYANGCTSLTSLTAPLATIIDANNCALTSKSIGDILYAAYVANRANVNYDFSGGTNAMAIEFGEYLYNTYGLIPEIILAHLVALGGDIDYNT